MNKLPLLVLATLSLLAAPVATFAHHWTSTCSSGATIDESSLSLYAVQGPSLFFASGQTGVVQARYNVTNTVTRNDSTPPYSTFELGYTDTSSLGSVTAVLWEVDPCTGVIEHICEIISVDSPEPTCLTCSFPTNSFNFTTNLYYVIVTLSTSSTTVSPQAHSLRIY